MCLRRRSAWIVATVFALSLVVTSVASAAGGVDRQQNKRIEQTRARTTALEMGINDLSARLKVIETAAPAIIQGLQDLKAGLTTAGEGLTKLKTLATSTEYGIGQLIVISAGPTANPQAGSFLVTPDIPDAVQQAQTTQQFVAQHSGNLAVAFGVRSAESDGTGSSLPAALCKVTVTNAGGTTQTTAANPSIGGLPFQPVNDKSALTSTIAANAGFPFGLKTTAPDEDKTTTFVSTVPVAASATYTAGLSCVDTSPDANDPSA
jgi:hypothetical protein